MPDNTGKLKKQSYCPRFLHAMQTGAPSTKDACQSVVKDASVAGSYFGTTVILKSFYYLCIQLYYNSDLSFEIVQELTKCCVIISKL